MTGATLPLEHCAIHTAFQPECPVCVKLNQRQSPLWQPDPYSPVDTVAFMDTTPASAAVDNTPDTSSDPGSASSYPDSSAGFDGFDGGSSGGGGASGDW